MTPDCDVIVDAIALGDDGVVRCAAM